MCKGGGGQTTTTQSGPPADVLADYDSLIAQGQQVAQQPLQQYSGPLVAGFTPDQTQAQQTIEGSQGLAQPYINSAAQEFGQATTPLWDNTQQYSPDAINQYESPYTQQVTQATQNLFDQQNAQQLNQVKGNAIAQGAFGGDREGVAEAQTAQAQNLAQAPVLAQIQQQGFTNAQNEFNTQQGQQLSANEAQANLASQAGYGLAGLGTSAQNTALQGALIEDQSGQQQQALEQEQLNIPYEQFIQQQAYPYQQLQFLGNLTEGLGGASGGQSSTTAPGADQSSQLLGEGLSAAALAMMFLKDGGRAHRAIGGPAMVMHMPTNIAAIGTSPAMPIPHGGGVFGRPASPPPINRPAASLAAAPMMAPPTPATFNYTSPNGVAIPQMTGSNIGAMPAAGASLANPLPQYRPPGTTTSGSGGLVFPHTTMASPIHMAGGGDSSSSGMDAIGGGGVPNIDAFDPALFSIQPVHSNSIPAPPPPPKQDDSGSDPMKMAMEGAQLGAMFAKRGGRTGYADGDGVFDDGSDGDMVATPQDDAPPVDQQSLADLPPAPPAPDQQSLATAPPVAPDGNAVQGVSDWLGGMNAVSPAKADASPTPSILDRIRGLAGIPMKKNNAGQPLTATDGSTFTPGAADWKKALLVAGLGIMGGRSPNGVANIAQGALRGFGEYEREEGLDAHPTVDTSGPTTRVWYPSEKKWVDTGIPTGAALQRQQQASEFGQTNDLNKQRLAQQAAQQKAEADFRAKQLQQTGAYQQGELSLRGQELGQQKDYQTGELGLRKQQADAEAARGQWEPTRPLTGADGKPVLDANGVPQAIWTDRVTGNTKQAPLPDRTMTGTAQPGVSQWKYNAYLQVHGQPKNPDGSDNPAYEPDAPGKALDFVAGHRAMAPADALKFGYEQAAKELPGQDAGTIDKRAHELATQLVPAAPPPAAAPAMPGSQGNPLTPRTQADIDRAPSGTWFMTPQGPRVKPSPQPPATPG